MDDNDGYRWDDGQLMTLLTGVLDDPEADCAEAPTSAAQDDEPAELSLEDVVEDQREVPRRGAPDGLGDGDRGLPRVLRDRRGEAHGGERARGQERQRRVVPLAGQPAVLAQGGQRVLLDRLGQQRGLAEPGRRDDGGQAPLEPGVQPVQQPGSDDEPAVGERWCVPERPAHARSVRTP